MEHTPNHITPEERLKCIFLALVLINYGTIGFHFDDIYLPLKQGRGIHFHGIPCIIMYASFLFGAINLISVVIDHYDKRNNEINYQRFAYITRIIGWSLFFAAIIYSIFEAYI